MKLKYRMYNLTLYSLSGIQKGIQSYHAGMEYARLYWNDEDFQSWLENDKTVIILNGGTACQYEPYGSMEQNRDIIIHDLNIKFAYFLEPDLNQSLSGIAFLGPSEVYDKETGENAGMFQDGSPLEKYKLKDGTWVYEVIQACPWSSGPVIFLTLVDEQKQRIPSLDWPQEEIDNA